MLELKSIVKDNNLARLSFYRASNMYYTVAVEDVGYDCATKRTKVTRPRFRITQHAVHVKPSLL